MSHSYDSRPCHRCGDLDGCHVPNRVRRAARIVVLCGSTRFKAEFETAMQWLTFDGCIVLTVGSFGHADSLTYSPEQKKVLDELHLRKIDIADEVFVINPGGYIGESTKREIEYARKVGRTINYLERVPDEQR